MIQQESLKCCSFLNVLLHPPSQLGVSGQWGGPHTVRALYKNNPIFTKGAFCSYSSGLGSSFGEPLGNRTGGLYEEDEDVRDVVGRLSRPFLFLSL